MELKVFFFLPGIKMLVNPWLVENVHAFSFLNCPECAFKTKTEDIFKTHAVSNHPLSGQDGQRSGGQVDNGHGLPPPPPAHVNEDSSQGAYMLPTQVPYQSFLGKKLPFPPNLHRY